MSGAEADDLKHPGDPTAGGPAPTDAEAVVDREVLDGEDGKRPTGRHLSGPGAWLRPLDDLRVGDTFTSRGRTITEADVVGFAALTGDWHPAHTNVVWAADNMFGERVAHGMLVVCYAIGLVPNDYIMALRRMRNVVFKKPVLFGDTVHVEGKATNILVMSDEVGMVTGRWRIVNQHGKTAVTMDIDALWRRAEL